MSYVYVVTNSDLGWDCVIDVCSDEKFARQNYSGECDIITPMEINDSKAKSKEEAESGVKYDVKPYKEVEDMFLIVDTCGICTPEYYEKNTLETISEYSELFEEFCKLNNINCGNIYVSEYERDDGTVGGWLSKCDGLKEDPSIDPENFTSPEDSDFSSEFSKWAEAEHGVEAH